MGEWFDLNFSIWWRHHSETDFAAKYKAVTFGAALIQWILRDAYLMVLAEGRIGYSAHDMRQSLPAKCYSRICVIRLWIDAYE